MKEFLERERFPPFLGSSCESYILFFSVNHFVLDAPFLLNAIMPKYFEVGLILSSIYRIKKFLPRGEDPSDGDLKKIILICLHTNACNLILHLWNICEEGGYGLISLHVHVVQIFIQGHILSIDLLLVNICECFETLLFHIQWCDHRHEIVLHGFKYGHVWFFLILLVIFSSCICSGFFDHGGHKIIDTMLFKNIDYPCLPCIEVGCSFESIFLSDGYGSHYFKLFLNASRATKD